MKGFRVLFILFIFMGFAFIIMQQRLESHDYDRNIQQLSNDIVTLNHRKRELQFSIRQKMQEITLFNNNDMGVPISARDIIWVSLPTNNTPSDSDKTLYAKNSMDKWVEYLLKKTAIQD